MELFIYDEIYDLTEQTKAITEATEDVTITINSPGGSAFAAFELCDAIKHADVKVTANVRGITASAAAVIAMACEEVNVDKYALVMLHNCWSMAIGNAKELKQEAEAMEKVDSVIQAYIIDHCNCPEEMKEAMDNGDVWLTADECAQYFDHCNVVEHQKPEGIAACATSLINSILACRKPFKVAEAVEDVAEPEENSCECENVEEPAKPVYSQRLLDLLAKELE